MSDEHSEIVTWVDAFPWIERAISQQKRRVNLPSPVDLSRQWLRAVDTQAEAYPLVLQRVAELADDAMPMTSLGELFPFVPQGFDMTDDAIQGINTGDVLHSTPETFSDIEQIFLVDSLELANWGVTQVSDLIASLAGVNVRYAISHEVGLADLVQALPPITAANSEDTSRPYTPEPADTVYELVEDFLTQFNERDLRILVGRKLSQPQRTLDAIGLEFGVTRERVRQIEAQINRQLSAWFDNNKEVELHSQLIREHVGTLCTLESLLAKYPALVENIIGLDMPSWFVFDQFDDSFESDGTWVAVPSLQEVAGEFDGFFEANTTDEGYVEIDRLTELLGNWAGAEASTVIEWAKARGYSLIGDLLVGPSVRSMNSMAVVALAHLGEPTPENTLHAMVARDKSSRSFGNQLAGDSRLTRVGSGTWALAAWGAEEYRGIREEILRRVEVNGSIPLADLIAELPSLYNVSPSSVQTYATMWPLEINNGAVRRAAKPTQPSRPVNRGKGVVFIEGGLAFRTVAVFDHLRGSGFIIPAAFASAIGVEQGSAKEFTPTSDEKPVIIRWRKSQPQVSSIRPNLIKISAAIGDVIAITFKNGASNVVSYGSLEIESDKALRQLMLLKPDAPLSPALVATALGLPVSATWQEILNLAQARHEGELVAAIQGCMGNQL